MVAFAEFLTEQIMGIGEPSTVWADVAGHDSCFRVFVSHVGMTPPRGHDSVTIASCAVVTLSHKVHRGNINENTNPSQVLCKPPQSPNQ